MGYSNTLGLKDERENSGFQTNATPLSRGEYLRSQGYDLDEKTGQPMKVAQKKAGGEKAANDATLEQDEALKAQQKFTHETGFVATPVAGTVRFQSTTTQTAYGLENITSALKAWLKSIHDNLLMHVIMSPNGTRSITLYAGNVVKKPDGVARRDFAAPPDDDSEEDDEATPETCERDEEDHAIETSELVVGKVAIQKKFRSMHWDEDQVATVVQHHVHGDKVALVVGRDIDHPYDQIDSSAAVRTLARSLQLATRGKNIDDPIHGFSERIIATYEEPLAEQGQTAYYKPDPAPYLAYERFEKRWAKKRKGNEPDTESDIEEEMGHSTKKRRLADREPAADDDGQADDTSQLDGTAGTRKRKRDNDDEDYAFDAEGSSTLRCSAAEIVLGLI